jgi:hypothetical protein
VATVADGPSRGRSLQALLDVVFLLNCDWLAAHPECPDLYESHVRYGREPADRREEFATIPVVLAQGWGDCDDLAPWYAAELTVRCGVPASPRVMEVRPGLWHVVVVTDDGETADPCVVLGMGASTSGARRSH